MVGQGDGLWADIGLHGAYCRDRRSAGKAGDCGLPRVANVLKSGKIKAASSLCSLAAENTDPGRSSAWSRALDWGSRGRRFKSSRPE